MLRARLHPVTPSPCHPVIPMQPNHLSHHLKNFRSAIAERAAGEERLQRDYGSVLDDIERRHQRTLETITEKFDAEESLARQTFEATQTAALKRFETHFRTIQKDYQNQTASNRQWYETERDRLQNEAKDAGWMVTSVLDTQSSDGPYRELKTFRNGITTERAQLKEQLGKADEAYRDAIDVLTNRRQWRDFNEPVQDEPANDLTIARDEFDHAFAESNRTIKSLRSNRLSKLTAGWGLLLTLVLVFGVFFFALFIVDPKALPLNVPQETTGWMLTSAVIAIVPTVLFGFTIFGINRARVGQSMRKLQRAMVRLRRTHQRWRDLAGQELKKREEEYERWHTSVNEERKQSLARIQSVSSKRLRECEQRRQTSEQETESRHAERMEELGEMRDNEIEAAEQQLQAALSHLKETRDRTLAGAVDGYERTRSQHLAEQEREFAEIAERWQQATTHFEASAAEIDHLCNTQTAAWQDCDETEWMLPEEVPAVLRVGHLDFELRQLENGLPTDDRLRPNKTAFELPIALSFPECGSLLFRAKGDGLESAVDVMRATMLKFLTSLPPGKIRFTVIDPAGLGEAFAGFMHLTDFDPLMIGNRIWTDAGQIEKRLAEFSEHMENIFQAYLRNEFATIDEYNQQAHEVAEPYHVLVVASFPTNFTEAAARRLANIAASGSRCGVYTLISLDDSQKPPHNFDVTKLEADARVLQWTGDTFVLKGEQTEDLPLTLDEPPEADVFNRIIKAAGAKHQNARRVEVPFERIAPKADEIWSKDSRAGIDVPLGRAGATKLQYLRLGRGTSQHVLVAGKTGAGKSSFLHAFITNLALHYGPDEVEFYLVDFKKGVEFNTYATNELPHARVIGIESDREFGVSVLERLDGILKERGELFREHGVQDIESYRDSLSPKAAGPRPDGLPRIMLVVDEFQEFFVEDDAMSQSASLLLDRLVRQGRAFGIHVLLGSQTLGGAYSLARSTLGQVAVRIALQCSESDAHLILSEENTAARLLTRPGEAIYNDANGLVEGNHPFQIAWLADKQREASLRQLHRRAEREQMDATPAIVFEGNVASDARRNRNVVRLFEEFTADERVSPKSPAVWLGEAVSITDPTQINFQRRPGDNLLIVGRNAKEAHGQLATTFLTLAAQLDPRDFQESPGSSESDTSTLIILDGDSLDDEDGPAWETLIETVPFEATHATPSNAADPIASVAELVKQRIAGEGAKHPVYLFISDLSRFRDLRNEGDNYGFPGFENDAPPNPGAQLAEILRDGPAVGVHTIVWCDNATNLTRWIGHAGLREFEMRIAFPMNSADSSNLIDTPAASRLGPHRALLYRGETGGCEKFRPYAVPSNEWLSIIGDQLHGRESEIQLWDDFELLTIS